MIATSDINSFKTILSTVSIEQGGVKIPSAAMQALGIEIGDTVRYLVV